MTAVGTLIAIYALSLCATKNQKLNYAAIENERLRFFIWDTMLTILALRPHDIDLEVNTEHLEVASIGSFDADRFIERCKKKKGKWANYRKVIENAVEKSNQDEDEN